MTYYINSQDPLRFNEALYRTCELGLDYEEVAYVRQNHELQLRIGGEPFQLFTRATSGSFQSGTISSWTTTSPKYSAYVWVPSEGETAHPDTRVQHMANFRAFNDGIELTRVLHKDYIVYPTEFAVEAEVGSSSINAGSVRIWFAGNLSAGTITYTYRNICSCVDNTTGYPNRACPSCKGTSYPAAFTQYLTAATEYNPANTILVRIPLAAETIPVSQIGRVTVRENRHWTLWQPYINNYDIIRGTLGQNKDVLFEVVRKSDSRLRGVLLHQQFDTLRIEESDIRYTIIPSLV